MSYNDWEAFWLKRGPLRFNEMKPFLHNFYVFHQILVDHFGSDLKGLSSLEVGAGRGSISHYLRNFEVNVKCLDLKNRMSYSHLPFQEGDVFDLPYKKPLFDIVFTYGLLEHFEMDKQVEALNNMLDITYKGGINVHYIVPLKMTNMFEDRNVSRNDCFFLRQEFPMIWTYPIHNMGSWQTNKWLGKGAFFKLEKEDEDTRTSNCQIKQQESTIQEQSPIGQKAFV